MAKFKCQPAYKQKVYFDDEQLDSVHEKRDCIAAIPLFYWGGRSVSNRRPPEPQSGVSETKDPYTLIFIKILLIFRHL